MKKKKKTFFFRNKPQPLINSPVTESRKVTSVFLYTPFFPDSHHPYAKTIHFINQPFYKKYYFSILLRIFKEKRLILVQPLNQSPRGKYINLIWTNIYSRNSIFPFWQLAFLKLLASDKMTTKQTAWLKSFRWTYK